GQNVTASSWIGWRGGTGRIFSNSFPSRTTACYQGGFGKPPFNQGWYATWSPYDGLWPGIYSSTPGQYSYPGEHQPGWGFTSGARTMVSGVAASNKQNKPGAQTGMPAGQDGFNQSLEPHYLFNNTNNSGSALIAIVGNSTFDGRAYSISNSTNA